ncbi:hypothetical protein KIN20_034501 [Parelaphostrongylus tenuis]|uniref:RecQ-mediated genome instability protein 1 n=1 Tax=Parelaphostrongylus tenuis TaxID=148309 RepID=A0AAD5R9Q8_PARTN|nr:hypothetical protein KIN20_034501 [Parelaphostrongylus tenuis]
MDESSDVRCVRVRHNANIMKNEMEDILSFVFDFFMERHIVLKEEWISNVLAFLISFFEAELKGYAPENPKSVASLMYEQWKYTDISDSTYPLLKQLGIDGNAHKVYVRQPLVLQVTSIVDIGASFHSQFCALVHEFVDNTGFEPLPDMERGRGLEDFEAKPRRMLSFTVSDGETTLRAIEYHSIKSLSLLTKPGCKILLIPPILCRKGVFLLKPSNVQLLGGDVQSLFMTGRPLQVMSEKLNLPIPASKADSSAVNGIQTDCVKRIEDNSITNGVAAKRSAKKGLFCSYTIVFVLLSFLL